VEFIGYDGAKWKAELVDIALQLIYHSIHHRAQMQMLIRQQGRGRILLITSEQNIGKFLNQS